MADGNYVPTLNDIGAGLVDLTSDTLKAVLCTSAYVPDYATDHYLADIDPAARISTVTLTGQDWTGAVLDADDVTFTAPPSGHTITQVIVYQDQSPESGARLLRRISADTMSGFPFDTNDADVLLAWPNDAAKIFDFVNP
jgi:hypothetical protein